MSEFTYLAIEGNSFAGKTTLAEKLGVSIGLPVVQEYFHFTESFPDFPPRDYQAAKANVDFFLEVEKRRLDYAREAASRNERRVIIFDRSPYTIIAFQYIVSRRLPNTPHSYEYSVEAFELARQAGQIEVPDSVLYLSPTEDVFASRVRERGRVSIDHLNDFETVQVMEDWYRRLYNVQGYDSQYLVSITQSNPTGLLEISNKWVCANRIEIEHPLKFRSV